MGSCNNFSYTLHIGSNWYIDSMCALLRSCFFRANSDSDSDLMAYVAKIYQNNRPIYAVLNTHNLQCR